MTVLEDWRLGQLIRFGILVFLSLSYLKAQQLPAPKLDLERELIHAEALLRSFKNDSAIALTSHLLQVLNARKQVDSPFGIRVQLAEADAYEQDQQSELAIQKTLQVQQKSQRKGLWEVHARACLILALIYEKTSLKQPSRQQLDLAKANIDRYGLGRIYPYFAVRRSSWERFYGDRKTALFFAREALRTAPKYGLLLEEAIGHRMLDRLLPESVDNERLYHCLKAVRLYQQLRDYSGCSTMLSNISQIYLLHRAFGRALAYNDSAIVQARLATTEGSEYSQIPHRNYQQRSTIYEQMGMLDSALANARISYQLELEYQAASVQNKIIEIESRYQNQHKQKQIDQQQLALSQKNSQLRTLIIIGGLILSLTVGLALSYRKQRLDKRRLSRQNALIQQQATQLKTLDAAKSRFFANVSHELRTPLTLLVGPVKTLLTENHLTNKQIRLLQLARRSGRQLDQLIADLLDLGKLELGKLELDEQPTPVAAFVRHHCAQFESLAITHHLHYTVDIRVSEEVVANLDQAKCRQILNNLLTNAFKFTPADGRVKVTLTLTSNQLGLTVADTGPGIHPDDRPHLFERYFQTTRPDKPVEGGTGIGLALCQEYSQLMGGTIDVESTLDSGSVFRVMVPITILAVAAGDLSLAVVASWPSTNEEDTAYPIQTVPKRDADVSPATNRPTLLVVEDNPDLQAYIQLILADTYTVLTAQNGQEALERLRTSGMETAPISLILSDIMMPVMDGHQLLERLKAEDATRHLPVIMLTARADTRDKLRALRIGVDDYLLKPFDEGELLARIGNLLTNQAARLLAAADPIESSNQTPPAPRPLISTADRSWLESVEAYVGQHLADPALSVLELAHQFSMSESTLLRQLKRLTGLTPVQYIQAVRLAEARRLLESRSARSVAQVAALVGYEDASSFARRFRQQFGQSPSAWLGSDERA